MIRQAGLWAFCLLILQGRPSTADVVTLKNGREIEGLIVETDETRVTLVRATSSTLESWQLLRSNIASVELSAPDVVGFRAVAHRLESDRSPTEAGDAWRRVCVLRPEGMPDLLRLIQCYRRMGKLDEADAAARMAARARPKDPRIPLERGEIALAQRRMPDAVAFAREHLRLDGASPGEGSWLLARALDQGGKSEEALAAYRCVLKDQPQRGEALERLVDLALGQGKADEAVDDAERMTRAAPELRAGWIALGKIRYRQSRFSDAVASFQSATRLGGPDYDRARIFLRCALARRFDRDPRSLLAASDLETARQLDPELRSDQP